MRHAAVVFLVACTQPRAAPIAPTSPIPDAMPDEQRAFLQWQLDPEPDLPPLLVVAARGDVVAVRRLIADGADIDKAPDNHDNDFVWTPLTAARARNHVRVVELLERERAAESCHIFAQALEPLEIHEEIDGEQGHVTFPAGTRIVVSMAKGSWFLVHEYVRGEFRNSETRHGWTRSGIAPNASGRWQLASHPNGPYAPTPLAGPRLTGCHVYSARIVDPNGAAGWVRAARGPGWSG